MTIKSLSLSSPKKVGIIAIFLILLLLPLGASAGMIDKLAEFVGSIIYWTLFWPFVLIMQLEMVLLPIVAQYGDFVREEKVVETWKILRDLANMFFIVLLLIMSFGTILQLKGYGYKNLLSSILIMAILINFSRTIIGLAVDFVQIIMLTFVAAWKDVAAGSFQSALGLHNTLNLDSLNRDGAGVTWSSFISAVFLGGIMLIVAVVLIGIFLLMLVLRIVTLWILTILSPLAFLAYAYPQTKKYYNEWEQELTKSLIIGPALAFFLWLTFTITGNGDVSTKIVKEDLRANLKKTEVRAGSNNSTIEEGLGGGGPTKGTTVDSFLNYIVAIALLVSGLKFASQSGTAGAGIARSGLGKLESYASNVNKGVARQTIGRFESAYSGGYKMLGGEISARAGAVKGKLSGQLAGFAIDEKGKARALGKVPGAGRFLQSGAMQIRGADERRRDERLKRELAAIPERYREEYLRSRAGAGGYGSRRRPMALTPADERRRLAERIMTAGGSTDYEYALAERMGKPGRKLDPQQVTTIVETLRKGGNEEAIKNLQSRYANAYNAAEADEAVKDKGAKVLENLRSESITDEDGSTTEGFKHLISSLLDPASKVAHTEIVDALKKMDKAAQKAAKAAMKEMKVDIDAIKDDSSDVIKRDKDGNIATDAAGNLDIKANADNAAVKMASVAGVFNPGDVTDRIEEVVSRALASARTDEEKTAIEDVNNGLRKKLWDSVVAKADFGNLNLADMPEMNVEGSDDYKLMVEYARRASSEQQKQFMLANKDQKMLQTFVGILEKSGLAVNSIVRNTAYPKTGPDASKSGSKKKSAPSDEGLKAAFAEFEETGTVASKKSTTSSAEDSSAEDEEA